MEKSLKTRVNYDYDADYNSEDELKQMNDFKDFEKWIEIGSEIEFSYKGKNYSVTYFVNGLNQEGISFCEFYKEPVEFYTVEDFMNNAKIDNELLKDIWDKVTDISVF